MEDTPEYLSLQKRLAQGWNTWDTRSLLCWVNLPSAIALNLGIKSYAGANHHLRGVQVGKQDVKVGAHAHDGSFSDLTLTYSNTTIRVRTATENGDLVVLVEPNCTSVRKSLLVIEMGILWNQPGSLENGEEYLFAKTPATHVKCYPIGKVMEDPNVHAMGPYLSLDLSNPVGLSTGQPRSIEEVQSLIDNREAEFRQTATKINSNELTDIIQTCTAWDTIYEPLKKRVVTPVSRFWNDHIYGGYALFCWDTFFAGVLASVDHEDLAHANVIEILREVSPDGFIPNVSSGSGRVSLDRSQPPVGSISILDIYHKFNKKWVLEQSFEPLLRWNSWWLDNRVQDGYLCWGSTPYEPVIGDRRELSQQNTRFGAALESGLDNSPMYDDIPFLDQGNHLMQMADVGLMSLYISDCKALAEIALEIGRKEDAEMLIKRADKMSESLQTLWSEEHGLFLNQRLDSGEFQTRLSPTHFYPLLAEVATDEQAQRMIDEHFFNPDEFWGEWILPSISKNDPAYPEQDYWRGRIWAPMNWLVYLGLCKYPKLEKARLALVEKSKALVEKEWRTHRHVHENYNNNTGEGCDIENSDFFYHWGCLLALIPLREGTTRSSLKSTDQPK